MLNLVVNNTITFNRIPYYLCSGYNIKITYNDNASEIVYVENTQSSNPIKELQEFDYNVDLTWKLPSNVIATSATDIKVFINSVEIDTMYFNYNKLENLITIDGIDVTPNDIVKIEYNCDKILYEHNTTNLCSYKIYPIYKNNYKIGQHTKI